MSNKEKKIVVLLIVIILIVVLGAIAWMIIEKKQQTKAEEGKVNEEKYLIELEDGTKINTSEELNSTKIYKELEISNIQFTQKDGKSVIIADVRNTGSVEHKAEIIKIEIIGENNEVIAEIKPVIGQVAPGETIKLNATITADVANAKDIIITEK